MKVTVNIDDFGFSEAADQLAVSVLKARGANSVSIFATCDRLPAAKEHLAPYLERIDTGVHLDLSCGSPLTNGMPWLHEGDAPDFSIANLDPEDVEAEFRAQIDCYRDSGLPLTHIDNHRSWIYLVPELFGVVLKLANEYDVPVRTPYVPGVEAAIPTYSSVYGIPEEKLRDIAKTCQTLQSSSSVRFVPQIYMLSEKVRTSAALQANLERLNSTWVEIICHAGQQHPRYLGETEFLLEMSKVWGDTLRRRTKGNPST